MARMKLITGAGRKAILAVNPGAAPAKRGPRREMERGMQVNLFTWAKLARAEFPELDLLFAVPNGGARERVTAARMKAEGVKAGVPDMFLPVARGGWHGLWIELKAGKNQLSAEQKSWTYSLEAKGYAVHVVWDDWEQAKGLISGYLRGQNVRIVGGVGR